MNRHVNAIAGRLSLRPPQRRALEILDRITEIAPPKKGADVDAALAAAGAHGGSFIRRFWGYEPHHVEGGASCSVKNGPHIANRVGHVQGGISLGLAAATACAALTPHWALTSISACYISPGEGRSLKARSRILHHGRLTSVVRTQITGKHNRRVLEVVTTHASRAR